MTEAETAEPNTDTAADSDRGPRGASFPTMDLAKAVETVHRIGGHGADFAVGTFAQYCGHKTANSGPFRTKLAAFRDWAMVTTKDGRVLLTSLGKEVALSANPTADEALLRRAFDACTIFKDFYDNQAKDIPHDSDSLGRRAMHDFRVSPKSQERFVSTLVESAVTVGLASVDADSGDVTFSAGSARPAAVEARQEPDSTPLEPGSATPGTSGATLAARTQEPRTTSTAPVLLRQVWPTATGELVLAVHSTDPLPASAFELVGKVVEAAAALADAIGPAAPGGDDDAA